MRIATSLASISFALAVSMSVTAQSFAQTASGASTTPQTSPGIAIVGGPGSSSASPTFAHVDFGTRPAGPQAPLVEEYDVRNEGKTAVSVMELQPSCKCTSGQLVVGGKTAALPADLTAGEDAEIVVTVRLSILKPGPVDKFLSVRTAGSGWPAVTFEITGTLTPAPPTSPG
jgi:hypothetical protein